jgi:outer membrane immunogenic protein
MRKSLLLGAAFVALAGPAYAADLGARMPYKAPPPPPPPLFSWTGCYIGGNVGGGFGHTDMTDDLGAVGVAGTSAATDTSGFIGGGQVGCNYQFGGGFVVGAEGMFDFGDIQGSNTFTNLGATQTINSKTDWLTSATGRIGYGWDRWMLYAKGGAAWAHDNFNWNGTAFGGPFNAGATDTRLGWTVGGGLEWAFWSGWSARVEYDFYDFGTNTYSFTDSVTGLASPFDVKNTISTVTLGINYRFGAY